MKSYENKPKEELGAPDGLISEEQVVKRGDDDSVTTLDPISTKADEPVMVEDVEPAKPVEPVSTSTEAPVSVEHAEHVAHIDTSEWEPVAEPFAEKLPVDESAEPEPARHFWPPTREQLWTGIAFWGVILVGVVLRFWGLGDKPLHHDESLHAYFSMLLMHNNMENWSTCWQTASTSCYHYDPLTHGPFQFHIIAFIYKISQLLGAPDHGINTTTVRIAAATLGSALVALPYFLRDYLGKVGAWLACFLLAVSPSMVYYSRFAREDIYMAFFTLLLVVAVARYIRDRNPWWLLTAALAFTLSYATKEATFLTIAVYGSFFCALVIWELGVRWTLFSAATERTGIKRFMPQTSAPWLLLSYFVVLGVLAKVFFGKLKELSIYITMNAANTAAADVNVNNLKLTTQAILPWLGIGLAIVIGILLIREQMGHAPEGRHGLALRVDAKKQPVLDALLTMPWTYWFFAIVCSWFVFIFLFTALFTYMPGISDGIWQGLYYWLQQQQVARGGQPWYYYFMLIPLYEQIGVIFGVAGIIRCVLRPTRMRLFLVYWFVGNVFIYTWAGEKMPWLMIHMTMPMMLLAAVALEPSVSTFIAALRERLHPSNRAVAVLANSDTIMNVPVSEDVEKKIAFVPTRPRRRVFAIAGSVTTVVCAVLLLIPTLQNMFQVNYVHYADAPHEMMIYVQTSSDIDTLMNKIAILDQKQYGGQHTIPIGIVDDATWPFAWYIRDYKNVCFKYPEGCPTTAQTTPVIIASGDKMVNMQYQNRQSYQFHQYHLRTQWDQGYMPPPCVPSKTDACTESQPYTGVGPWLWFSYGDNPPPGAKFDFGRAAHNIWDWWWQRKPFGSTDGTYDMGLFIKNDVSAATGVKP